MEGNLDSVRVADRDHAAADNLDSVAASVLAVVGRPVFQVAQEPEVPDWRQFVLQKTLVEELEALHGSCPPVADSAVADEPG